MESKSSMKNGGSTELGLETSREGKEVRVANKRRIGTCESLLRILALVLTLSAAVILGVDKQTKIVQVQLLTTLPPLSVPVSAKWHYLSAFTYFVVANAIGCAYAALSLVLSFANRDGKSSLGLLVFIVDAVMTGLLFSANGAAAAIGLLGFKGNSHVQWKKVCNVFGKFCDQAAVALVVSLLGAIAFLLLIVFAAKRLHNK